MSVELIPMTRELFHELFNGFEYDPVMFEDEAQYEKYRNYVYDPEKVDAHFDSRAAKGDRISFAVTNGGAVVGEVVIKHIDREARRCELGVHLKNDSVKGRGVGTEAERQAVGYAFDVLGMECAAADCLKKNARSQHVLEKLGFVRTGEKDGFMLYELHRKSR